MTTTQARIGMKVQYATPAVFTPYVFIVTEIHHDQKRLEVKCMNGREISLRAEDLQISNGGK